MTRAELSGTLGPSLPAQARTRDGAVFNPRLLQWSFRVGAAARFLNFEKISHIDPHIMLAFQATMLWYAQNKSIHHTSNMFELFHHFFSTVGRAETERVRLITPELILNYRNALPAASAWYLGSLAGALKKWAALGWPGVDPETVKLLDEMRLKGNRKGEAVRVMDPFEGPFSNIERQALFDAVKNAWAAGRISLEDNVLAWLALLLAPRPDQLANLKVVDLVCSTAADGVRSYILRVPRAKQPGQKPRGAFRDRPIIAEIGDLLTTHCGHIRMRLKGKVRDIDQAPMFPYQRRHDDNALEGFEWHATARSLSLRTKAILEGLAPQSERTGETLHITPTRLRRTLGTQAAMEGHGELVIAALLDHTDTQNAGVYVEARPEIVERIDRAMAIHLAPLAQAFAGVLISVPSDPDAVEKPILDPRYGDGQHAAGACGKHGFCGLAAPIACYTCRHFQAWVDGPHEEVLHGLLARREEQMAAGSARIAAINDRTILAVAQVVTLCADRRGATEGRA